MSFGYQVLGFGSGGGAAPLDVDYLVVAGGGAAVYGGGGAGGYRTSFPGGTKLTLKGGTAVPITVGDGALASAPTEISANGSPSTFAAATPAPLVSAGGGGSSPLQQAGTPGGSGGGSNAVTAPAVGNPGIGNVPPTTPPQGNDGGVGYGWGQACAETGGGGGGAGGNGGNGMGPYGSGGVGGVGAGVPTDFVSPSYGTPGPSPTIRYFAGGGSGRTIGTGAQAIGGYGGGGNGERYGRGSGCGSPIGEIAATAGTVNTGGGNGAGEPPFKAGGPGVVLVNAPADADFTIGPPTNVEITNPDGTKTAVFTVSGTIQNG